MMKDMTNKTEEMDLPPMFWAAVAAAALPMFLGLVGLFFCLVPTGVGRAIYQEYFISMPIALCFAFGTPLVAWLSCRNLIYKAPEDNENLFKLLGVGLVAVKYSFFVHALACLTHIILLSVFYGRGDLEAVIYYFGLFLLFGSFTNAVLFVLITLPLSVFCAAIFAWLYSGPKDSLAS